MAKVTDEILGHAEDNDGIEEYDNPLPDWWLGLFVITVLWGVGYAVNYHFVAQDSQEAFYDAEMAAAAEKYKPPKEVVAVEVTADAVDEGKVIYQQTCVGCHGTDLRGNPGLGAPNLVDDQWIHGGAPDQIQATIANGVLDKGMPQWGPVLGPAKIAKVVAYIVASKEGGADAPQ
jgi:cytochrome c oxidase cbb3-type subunit 3